MATSTDVKRRYNEKTYTTYRFNVRKDDEQIIEKIEAEKLGNGLTQYVLNLIRKDLGIEEN